MILKSMMIWFCLILRNELVRTNKIVGIENYFYHEINQGKTCSEKLNEYVTVFDHTDKILIVLSATSGGVSIILFTSIIGSPVGIASPSLFFL